VKKEGIVKKEWGRGLTLDIVHYSPQQRPRKKRRGRGEKEEWGMKGREEKEKEGRYSKVGICKNM
jgi:hypothetical protein